METDVVNGDFVIKRKRKRHAVDPCLGFYSSDYSPPHVAPKHFFPGVSHVDASAIDSPSAHPCSPPRNICPRMFSPKSNLLPSVQKFVDVSSSDSVKNISSPPFEIRQVPAEQFLKRISRGKHIRKYGRRGRHIVKSSSSSPGQDTDDVYPVPRRLKRHRAVSTSRRLTSLSPGTLIADTWRKDWSGRLRKTAKTKHKPLAECLYQASVMCNGNAEDCLINPDILDGGAPSLRLPLRFVPESPGLELQEPKRRTWSLVDPRKAVPFQSASFVSHASLQESGVAFKPLTRWRDSMARNVLRGSRTRRESLPLAKHSVEHLSCPPLSFIPFQDAEDTYSQRLHSKILSKQSSSILHPGAAIRTSLHLFAPLAIDDVQDILTGCSSPPSRSSLHSLPPILPKPTSPPQCSEQLTCHTCTLDILQPTAQSFDFAASSPSPTPLSNKALKPLAFFFEDFLERGRHAEQIIQSSIMARPANTNANVLKGISPSRAFSSNFSE